MARDVVDSVIERGECDFANDVAGVLPSYVIAELLGIPLEDGYRLYELTAIMTRGQIDTRAVEAAAEMFAYAAELGPANVRILATTSQHRCCKPRSTASASPTWSSTSSSCC